MGTLLPALPREEANYRVYQFAGASHIRDIDAAEFGLADPERGNPADWVPFMRALFVAGDRWCDGIPPPPSIWLGSPNSSQIARDAKGNALVSHVGGEPVSSTGYRLPEVAVGENQYLPFDASYADGSFLGYFRALAGGHVDLTGTFTNHAVYVADITRHARALQTLGYLLAADADAIIRRAILSSIGAASTRMRSPPSMRASRSRAIPTCRSRGRRRSGADPSGGALRQPGLAESA